MEYCVYCKERIDENTAIVVDEDGMKYHILCYLQMLDIQLDMIDENKLRN